LKIISIDEIKSSKSPELADTFFKQMQVATIDV